MSLRKSEMLVDSQQYVTCRCLHSKKTMYYFIVGIMVGISIGITFRCSLYKAMWIAQCGFVLLNLIGLSAGLVCYNCSSTDRDWNHCSGVFGTASPFAFNSSHMFLINCTGENAMCFVRSWSSRAKHAWLVQRGCYQSSKEDPLPRGLMTPTRSMACKHERLSDAEYKVCLCQADWCNLAKSNFPPKTLQFIRSLLSITVSIFIPYLYMIYQ